MPDLLGSYPTLNVSGTTIEYLAIPGNAELPTLVLLHEGLGCVRLWRDFPYALAEQTGAPVFVYSRAGYGGSDPVALPRPLNYMSIEAQTSLPQVLAAAEINEYVLVGHSDGATIALVYAGTYGAQAGLRGVIAMAPHVVAEQLSIDSIRQVREAYEQGGLREKLRKYHADNVECAFRGWCDSWLHADFCNWSVESSLAQIDVPLLLIQGRDDEYGTVDQLQRIQQSVAVAVGEHLLARCGHAPHLEAASETLDLIEGFCTKLRPVEV